MPLTVIILHQLHLGGVWLPLCHITLLDLTLCTLACHHSHHALDLSPQLLLQQHMREARQQTSSQVRWAEQTPLIYTASVLART